MKKTKKYKVSLSCSIPLNFECDVEAENEKEAFKLGIKKADEDLCEGLDENSLDYTEAMIDKEIKNHNSPGVSIEEI